MSVPSNRFCSLSAKRDEQWNDVGQKGGEVGYKRSKEEQSGKEASTQCPDRWPLIILIF